jgi:hypothetical protein
MKNWSALLLCLVVFGNLSAQTWGEQEWQKKKIPALVIAVPQEAKYTEEAIRQKWAQMGYSGKSSKGAFVYKGMKFEELGPETVDVYLQVERKGRKDKDESVVYFTVSRGYENYIRSSDDQALLERIKKYCLQFPVWAEAYALEEAIKEQESSLKSAERKAVAYQDEADDLLKRKRKLEEEIEENKTNLEQQKKDVENQRKALDVLKAKRKSN